MTSVQIYKPNSISLPQNSPATKHFPRLSKVPETVRCRLDTHTVFYDVFIDPSNSCLLAVGPDLKNLAKNLFPLKIRIDGKYINYDLEQIKGITLLETEQFEFCSGEPKEATFEFRYFSQTLIVSDLFRNCSMISHPGHRLTLSTLQKDNQISWISDWLIWHHQKYGVRRLVLYDNDSNNRQDLLKILNDLQIELYVIFVYWDFPHGYDPYKYCQRGSLNHCRLRFPVPRGYCINLDVDEYLFLSAPSLTKYLDQNLGYPRPGAMIIQQVTIPNVSLGQDAKQVRAWHFRYRHLLPTRSIEATYWENKGRSKYIYSFDDIGFNAIHSTDSFKNKEFRKRYSVPVVVLTACRKLLWVITKIFFRYKRPKPRIDTFYSELSECCFLHFWGLSTGWRSDGVPSSAKSFDSAVHEIEPRISEIKAIVEQQPR